jgi:hypothetical protein
MSDGGPHRAVNVSSDVNDRYYMRTAAGAQTMPHSLLADRFGRAANPRLRLRVKVGPSSPFAFVLSLVNEGRGAPRRPAIILKKFQLRGGELKWPSHPSHDGETGFVLRALPYGEVALESWLLEPFEDMVVYPGASRGVFSFWTSLDQTPQKITPVVLEYSAELHALDTQPVRGKGRLEINSIMDLLGDGSFELEG